MTPTPSPIGTAAITENLLKRRWSAVILHHLEGGVTDPEEIRRREPQISALAMNDRLRTMVRYELIEKLPRWKPTERVGYRLTNRGRNILKILGYISLLDQVPVGDPRPLEELLGLLPGEARRKPPLTYGA